MLTGNGELILKTMEIVNLMIIFDLLLTVLAWITGMIFPSYRRKVVKGLIISSNDKKATPALMTSKKQYHFH